MAREDNNLGALFKGKKDSEHKEGTLNSNTDNEKKYELVKGENATIHDVRESIMNRYQERVNKPKISDSHERYTFLLSNSNRDRLEMLSKGKKRGFKTHFINDAISAMLDAFEQNK